MVDEACHAHQAATPWWLWDASRALLEKCKEGKQQRNISEKSRSYKFYRRRLIKQSTERGRQKNIWGDTLYLGSLRESDVCISVCRKRTMKRYVKLGTPLGKPTGKNFLINVFENTALQWERTLLCKFYSYTMTLLWRKGAQGHFSIINQNMCSLLMKTDKQKWLSLNDHWGPGLSAIDKLKLGNQKHQYP